MNWRPAIRRAGLLFISTIIMGRAIHFLIGVSTSYLVTVTLMLFMGMHAGIFQNLNMTLIQARTPQQLMGRVMSIYMLCMMGSMPLGALLAGFMSDVTGTRTWYAVCAAATFAGCWPAAATHRTSRKGQRSSF